MTTAAVPASARPAAAPDPRRWWTLAVLCFTCSSSARQHDPQRRAPVAEPRPRRHRSELQWIVDGYMLVFAGLLLTAGARRPLRPQAARSRSGCRCSGPARAVGAAGLRLQLIAARALMGVGGALIMPATLSMLTNVFPTPRAGRAIGIWAGVAGARRRPRPGHRRLAAPALLLGCRLLRQRARRRRRPVVGGYLLVPVRDPTPAASTSSAPCSRSPACRAAVGDHRGPGQGLDRLHRGRGLRPRPPGARRVRPCGSCAADPMLDVRFFRNPRFSAASGAITLVVLRPVRVDLLHTSPADQKGWPSGSSSHQRVPS